MHRTEGAGATVDNKFTNGNPATGVAATEVDDNWLNAVQEEIISVLTAAGIEPETAATETADQLLAALQALGLRSATVLQSGVVQLASAASAQALTDASKVLTPSTLKAAGQGSNQLLTTSGYQKLPGGLILQWGAAGPVPATGVLTVTLPITFPNAVFMVVGASYDGGATANYRVNGSLAALTNFKMVNTYTSAIPSAVWFALGN